MGCCSSSSFSWCAHGKPSAALLGADRLADKRTTLLLSRLSVLDLVVLVLSFVPLAGKCVPDRYVFPNQFEFMLRKPRPQFAHAVWHCYARRTKEDPGIGLYVWFQRTYRSAVPIDPVRVMISVWASYFKQFAVAHPVCMEGFARLLSLDPAPLTAAQVKEIQNHLNFWLSEMKKYLQTHTLEHLGRRGFVVVMGQALLSLLISTQFRATAKDHVRTFLALEPDLCGAWRKDWPALATKLDVLGPSVVDARPIF